MAADTILKRLAGRILRGCRRRMVMLHSRFSRRPIVPPPNRVLDWLRDNCLPQHPVDGALVETLLAYGEKDLAVELHDIMGRFKIEKKKKGAQESPKGTPETIPKTSSSEVIPDMNGNPPTRGSRPLLRGKKKEMDGKIN